MTSDCKDLVGKVAIVTGTGFAGNIGEAIALALAEAGASVVCADLPGTPNGEIVAKRLEQGLDVAACDVDISDEASVQKLIQFTLEKYKRLDILVNNAGIMGNMADHDVISMKVEVWDKTMAVNARGTMLMCKHAIPHMMDGGSGSIINISSDSSLSGNLFPTAYGCSKGLINTLSKYVATQYSPKGVRCNALVLGLVKNSTTEFTPEPLLELFLAHDLTGRLGTPQDVAEMVHFLASDRATWITGQIIQVDGGFLSHFPVTAGITAILEGDD